jgi:hypothetical protein
MRRSLLAVAAGLTVCGCNTQAGIPPVAVPAGETRKLNFFTSLNADCSYMGDPDIRITKYPLHGKLMIEKGFDYTAFKETNQRYDCNMKKVPGLRVLYTPDPGFVGTDSYSGELIFPNGGYDAGTVPITVK